MEIKCVYNLIDGGKNEKNSVIDCSAFLYTEFVC